MEEMLALKVDKGYYIGLLKMLGFAVLIPEPLSSNPGPTGDSCVRPYHPLMLKLRASDPDRFIHDGNHGCLPTLSGIDW